MRRLYVTTLMIAVLAPSIANASPFHRWQAIRGRDAKLMKFETAQLRRMQKLGYSSQGFDSQGEVSVSRFNRDQRGSFLMTSMSKSGTEITASTTVGHVRDYVTTETRIRVNKLEHQGTRFVDTLSIRVTDRVRKKIENGAIGKALKKDKKSLGSCSWLAIRKTYSVKADGSLELLGTQFLPSRDANPASH
jgi:hypothetical protein